MNKFQYKPFGKKYINIPLSGKIEVDDAIDWIDEHIPEKEWKPGDVIISKEDYIATRKAKGIVTLQEQALVVRRWDPIDGDEVPWLWEWVSKTCLIRPRKKEVRSFYEAYPERRPKLQQYQRKTS